MTASPVELSNDFEDVLQSTEIATILVDEEQRIRSFTPAATEIYGLIDSDIGRPLSHLMPLVERMPPLPDLREFEVHRPAPELIRSHTGKTFLRRVLPFKSQCGERTGMVITFVDVSALQESQTELLKSQQQLQQQVRRLKTITDATPTMIAYVNTELCYEFVNQRYADRFGKSPSELIGANVAANMDAEKYAEVMPRLKAALRGEKSVFDFELQLPDNGGVLFKEVTCVPDVDDDATVVGCHIFAIDITERKHSALAEERLRLAAEAAGFGTYQIDLITGRTHWSTEFKKLVGAADDSDEKVRATEVAEFVHPDDRKSVARHMARARRAEDGGKSIRLRTGSCWPMAACAGYAVRVKPLFRKRMDARSRSSARYWTSPAKKRLNSRWRKPVEWPNRPTNPSRSSWPT